MALACTLLAGCDETTGTGGPSPTCTITTAVTPTTATADHSLAPPGNQVQFLESSTVTGSNCPLIADYLGSWSTSDPVNTAISSISDRPDQAVATCRNATSTPASISYSGTVRGKSFPTATLTCR